MAIEREKLTDGQEEITRLSSNHNSFNFTKMLKILKVHDEFSRHYKC